jgi:DNA-binding MarR family transcriptional regulator
LILLLGSREVQMPSTPKKNLIEDILKLGDHLFRQLLPSVPQDLTSLDVTMPQAKIMLNLYIKGPQRMSEIASELDVVMPTATSFIDRLVEKNYIVREPLPEDRRVVLCRLSEAGQKAISRIWESSRIRTTELLQELDTVKLKMLIEVLTDMLNSAKAKDQAAVEEKPNRPGIKQASAPGSGNA